MDIKYFPAIFSLLAGLIASIIMFFNRIPMTKFLVILLIILLVCYIVGTIIKILVVKLLDVTKNKEEKITLDDSLEVEAINQNAGEE